MSFIALEMLLLCWYSIFCILTVRIFIQFKKEAEIIEWKIPENIILKIAYFFNDSAYFSSSLLSINLYVVSKIEYINFLHNESSFFCYFT